MARSRTGIRLPSVRLPKVALPKQPAGWNRSEVAIRSRAPNFVNDFRDREPAGDPPPWWLARYPGGTRPEWAIYWALMTKGFKPEIDFYLHAQVPGLGESYYSQVDLFLPAFSLAIEVQGEYWHYGQGSRKMYHDQLRYRGFTHLGLTLIFIDESDALRDPIYYTEEALSGHDHSKLRRGF